MPRHGVVACSLALLMSVFSEGIELTPAPTAGEVTVKSANESSCPGVGPRHIRPLEKFLNWICYLSIRNKDPTVNLCKQHAAFIFERNGWVRCQFLSARKPVFVSHPDPWTIGNTRHPERDGTARHWRPSRLQVCVG